jgi:hypothetical protein
MSGRVLGLTIAAAPEPRHLVHPPNHGDDLRVAPKRHGRVAARAGRTRRAAHAATGAGGVRLRRRQAVARVACVGQVARALGGGKGALPPRRDAAPHVRERGCCRGTPRSCTSRNRGAGRARPCCCASTRAGSRRRCPPRPSYHPSRATSSQRQLGRMPPQARRKWATTRGRRRSAEMSDLSRETR